MQINCKENSPLNYNTFSPKYTAEKSHHATKLPIHKHSNLAIKNCTAINEMQRNFLNSTKLAIYIIIVPNCINRTKSNHTQNHQPPTIYKTVSFIRFRSITYVGASIYPQSKQTVRNVVFYQRAHHPVKHMCPAICHYIQVIRQSDIAHCGTAHNHHRIWAHQFQW